MTAEPLDPRLHAYRDDLAAESLRGRVEAPRYVAGEPAQVARAVIPLRSRPGFESAIDNEVLFGERLAVLDVAGGFAFVQLARDGYVGYVPADSLSREIIEPTHRVAALGTFVYPAADIKSPPLMHLSLGAELRIESLDERFGRLASGGFVIARHIAERGRFTRDFVEVAERFIGTPYLWGGRTRLGVDCSGLVQVALEAAGQASPRDSDMQQDKLGAALPDPCDLEGLARGDLVFWPGHVGLMSDGAMLLHANAHHMAVATEPLVTAVKRIASAGGPITAIRRLTRLGA